jgi:hypothetical protein
MPFSYEGLDELIAKLSSLPQKFNKFAASLAKSSVEAGQKKWEVYPPQPDRMRSGHFNTYVRGIGHVPKSEIIRTNGNVKLMDLSKARRTSEQMNTKFETSVDEEEGGVTGHLVNRASYAGWVIGPLLGDPHQVPWHTQTGWVDADKATQAATEGIFPALDEFFENALE